jgi:pyridoxal 5'-phosphate synthase pdxS subunit
VCGATNLGEALRRINEGACMIRTKGEAGTGNVVEAVRHLKFIKKEIAALKSMKPAQLSAYAKDQRVPIELVKEVGKSQRLPVVTFVAGGIATPADAALLMELGAEGVFVGSGIFKSKDPARMAAAIVQATVHFKDAAKVAAVSRGLGPAMAGLEISTLGTKMADRGW